MDPQYAESKVAIPAIGLLATAIVGMLLQVISIILNIINLVGGAAVTLNEDANGIAMLMQGGVGLMFNFLAVIMGGIIIFGAMKMKNLSGHGAAMAAAVIAMVPCLSPCCPLGLIFGIWAIVAMSDPEVKAAFEAQSMG